MKPTGNRQVAQYLLNTLFTHEFKKHVNPATEKKGGIPAMQLQDVSLILQILMQYCKQLTRPFQILQHYNMLFTLSRIYYPL